MVRAFVIVVGCFLASSVEAAKVVKVEGQAFVTPPGASERGAQAGEELVEGAKLRTGKDGAVEVTLDDGSLLKLRANSAMVLSGQKRQEEKSSSVLFFGRLWSKVSKSTTGNTNYSVTTPNAVCGVRGTEFETSVADDGSVRVQVTDGSVAVGEGAEGAAGAAVRAGQEIQGDESGVAKSASAGGTQTYEEWQQQKQERLKNNGRAIVDKVKEKILKRKDRLESLRGQQQAIQAKRGKAEERAKRGDKAALDEVRQYNQELSQLADEAADLGDGADSQFGLVDHFKDLAEDPRFGMVDAKYLAAEAANLRKVKAMLDKLVKEGTDISMKSMDTLLDDMSQGKRGTLKDEKGSSVDDMFGGSEMDME